MSLDVRKLVWGDEFGPGIFFGQGADEEVPENNLPVKII